MENRTILYPNDGIVIVQNLSGFTGGKTVDCAGIVNEDVQAGTVVVDNAGSIELLQSGVCQTAAGSGDTSIKLYKGHTFKVGDSVKAGAITDIDQTNADYDLATLDAALGSVVGLDEAIVNNGTDAIGVVVGSKVVKDDNTIDVGVMYRGTVNEGVFNGFAPVDADVKAALPLIVFVTE